MNSPRRLLPPMGALNSFAAAARLGSFSKAGREVGLTQSAVSRQVALLEEWLQTPLFTRSGRRVTLSAEGRAYAEAIAPALDRIRNATARAIERTPDNELTIATLPSFGMRWLAPRLPSLTEAPRSHRQLCGPVRPLRFHRGAVRCRHPFRPARLAQRRA